MIHLPASVRVYLSTSPCDMRRSFDGLHALVTSAMQLDAFAGHLFVFANRRKDRVKILCRGRDGFAVWAKRLEEGTCATPFGEEDEFPARDYGAGVRCAAKRHRSERCPAPEAIISARARKPQQKRKRSRTIFSRARPPAAMRTKTKAARKDVALCRHT